MPQGQCKCWLTDPGQLDELIDVVESVLDICSNEVSLEDKEVVHAAHKSSDKCARVATYNKIIKQHGSSMRKQWKEWANTKCKENS